MRKGLLSCVFAAMGMYANAQGNAYEERAKQYIEQYKHLAVAEQKRSGIPAAVTLAQGIHETSAGNSELATMANNHFGIKCKKEWRGETFAHTDDAPNECFRKYSRAEESYKDHSDYLMKSPRYAELFKLSTTDYAAWAVGLKRCGYATNPRYAQMLIKIVEDYKLQEYTYAALNNVDINEVSPERKAEVVPEEDARGMSASVKKPVKEVIVAPEVVRTPAVVAPVAASVPATAAIPAPAIEDPLAVTMEDIAAVPELPVAETTTNVFKPAYGQMVRVNGLKAIFARKGDTPLEYAYKTSIRYQKLLELNEIDERPLPHDMYLYLERKNTKGVRPTHIVKSGETTFGIAQAEGMQVKSLMDMNMLQPGEEPYPGTILELQKYRVSKPVVVIKKKAAPVVYTKPTAYPQVVATPNAATVPTTKVVKQSNNIVVTENIEQPVFNTSQAATIQEHQPTPVVAEIETPAVKDTVSIEVVKEAPVADAVNKPVAVVEPAVVQAPLKDTAAVVNAIPENVAVIDAPAKQHEVQAEVKQLPIDAVEPVAAINKQTTLPTVQPVVTAKTVDVPVIEEEPKDELDRLKRKFDKVVYAKDNVRTAPPVVQTVAVTPPKTDTIKAAVKEPVKPLEASVQIQPSNDATKYHLVKRGETGFAIAKKYGITVKQLNDWNSLNFGAIQEGQKLRVKP